MVKYCGFPYQGRYAIYNTEKELFFDNPYNALKNANAKWDANRDFQIARLLVVVAVDTANTSLIQYAFFQFTNSKACKNFITSKTDIVWSSNEAQVWNGNAQMM